VFWGGTGEVQERRTWGKEGEKVSLWDWENMSQEADRETGKRQLDRQRRPERLELTRKETKVKR